MTQPIMDNIIAHFERLPEIPRAALRVNEMLNEPDVEIRELADVIMVEPGLTLQVLRLCNSAEYGFTRRISTLTEAVTVLGYKELSRIMMTIISHGVLNRPLEGYALNKGDLWENAITCGVYARHLATDVGFADPEMACIAALLRDIGKIATESFVKDRWSEIEAVMAQKNCAFDEAEEIVLGVNHTQVGRVIAQQWNLPDPLVQVITYRHRPSLMPADLPDATRQLVCIIHLADIFTLMNGAGVGMDGLRYGLDNIVFKILDLSKERLALEALFGQLLGAQPQIKGMLNAISA